jgi:hypothetical protein
MHAESIPLAGLGQIAVITVAHREAPEFKFLASTAQADPPASQHSPSRVNVKSQN